MQGGARASTPDIPLVGTTPPTAASVPRRGDYVLAGGGLQNGLIALAVLARRPDADLTLIERASTLGGNHTWCFHAGDIPDAAKPWLDALVVRRWPGYDVIFPGHRRQLDEEYCVITSGALHAAVSARVRASAHARIVKGHISAIGRRSVTLDDGRSMSGQLVIDARGPERGTFGPACGYQKFLGLELSVTAGSAPSRPILMDATVPQHDGFRFMYVLPLADDRVLVEDTYYSTDPRLEVELLRERVLEYAHTRGLRVQGVLREERGVLPIPTRPPALHPSQSPIVAGYAGGFFHPTTGYSMPVALRFALLLAEHGNGQALEQPFARWLDAHRRQVRFCLWLNRLLFGAFGPDERYHVLERFYRLPAATIRRFYALDTTARDRVRILCGRPPSGLSLRRLLSRGDDHE